MLRKSGKYGFLKTKKPIICYKFLLKSEQFKGDKHYNKYKNYDFINLSTFQGFKLNKNNFCDFFKDGSFNNMFSTFQKQPKSFIYLACYLCKCVIPKNSWYYVTPNGELVTSNLRIIGIIKAGRNTPEEIKKRNEKK